LKPQREREKRERERDRERDRERGRGALGIFGVRVFLTFQPEMSVLHFSSILCHEMQMTGNSEICTNEFYFLWPP
jgi:hypothetical protein